MILQVRRHPTTLTATCAEKKKIIIQEWSNRKISMTLINTLCLEGLKGWIKAEKKTALKVNFLSNSQIMEIFFSW